jgi:fucose 4-O-acetylase-like acetyltransferase
MYVETLRGLACILLVSYHVIGNTSENGLQLPADDIFSFANRLFLDVRMPLFSFISGFVFSAYARDLSVLGDKIMAKVRRLLVPMVAVGTLHYWTQYVFAHGGQDQPPYYQLFILPYDHFWYLQATFIIMIVVFAVTYWLKGNGTRAAAILLVPCVLAYPVVDRWYPDVFSSYKALYLAPYFLTGYLISHSAALRAEFDEASKQWRVIAAMSLLVALLFVIEYLLLDRVIVFQEIGRRALGLVVGLSTCVFFFVVRFRSHFLAFIGDKSYAIFLFHVFFTAGSRIILEKLLPGLSTPVLFSIGLVAGIVGPICVAWVALKHPVTALLCLGVRMQPKARGALRPELSS